MTRNRGSDGRQVTAECRIAPVRVGKVQQKLLHVSLLDFVWFSAEPFQEVAEVVAVVFDGVGLIFANLHLIANRPDELATARPDPKEKAQKFTI